MADWQPIETAPKDGTIIDLWISNDFLKSQGKEGFVKRGCRWGDSYGGDGWCEWGTYGDHQLRPHYEWVSVHGATHWRPIDLNSPGDTA